MNRRSVTDYHGTVPGYWQGIINRGTLSALFT